MYLEVADCASGAKGFSPGARPVGVGKLDVAARNCPACPVNCQCSHRLRAGAGSGCMKMAFMALQADKRLTLLEEIIGDRAVRVVTDIAVLLNRAVLEHKRPLIAGVAVVAEVINALIGFQPFKG